MPEVQPNGPPPRKNGYQRLAEYMAWRPSQEIFSRFRYLNTRNLLLLQAEVAALEEQLEDAILRESTSSNVDFQQYVCNWSLLKEQGEGSEHWQLTVALKEKLAEYSKSRFHGPCSVISNV
jgi:hypothetical protein